MFLVCSRHGGIGEARAGNRRSDRARLAARALQLIAFDGRPHYGRGQFHMFTARQLEC